MLLWVVNKQLRLIPRQVCGLEGAWLLLTEPMFEFSRSVRRQVEFDGRKLVSVEGGGCSKRSNFVVVFPETCTISADLEGAEKVLSSFFVWCPPEIGSKRVPSWTTGWPTLAVFPLDLPT